MPRVQSERCQARDETEQRLEHGVVQGGRPERYNLLHMQNTWFPICSLASNRFLGSGCTASRHTGELVLWDLAQARHRRAVDSLRVRSPSRGTGAAFLFIKCFRDYWVSMASGGKHRRVFLAALPCTRIKHKKWQLRLQ